MFNYWYSKKNGRNFCDRRNLWRKKKFWWRDMIGSFRFCFQNFRFRSLSFGIGIWFVIKNSSSRNIISKIFDIKKLIQFWEEVLATDLEFHPNFLWCKDFQFKKKKTWKIYKIENFITSLKKMVFEIPS